MRVARYWRMKKQNYRLEGVRYNDGELSLQERSVAQEMPDVRPDDESVEDRPQRRAVTAA